MKKKILILILLLILVVGWGISKGAVNIPLGLLFSPDHRQILNLRLMRIVISAVAGSGLAICGVALQAILRNSLAEPYLLGTSSGAGLGAVLALALGVSWAFLPLAAFIGAALSVVLVYNLARQHNKISQQALILSGVIVSVSLSAVIVFIVSLSGNKTLHEITWWLWGGLQVYDLKALAIVSLVVILGSVVIYFFSQDLNAISIGEEEALHLGIDVEKLKKLVILLSSLITASLVCICGIIGFVGLVIPHMMRFVVGQNHKVLIPLSCLAGAVFMIACDNLSRILFAPFEIPIGVITAVIGAPVFIILLKRSQAVKNR